MLEHCNRLSKSARQVLGVFTKALDGGSRLDEWLTAVHGDQSDWGNACARRKSTLVEIARIRREADGHVRRLPDRFYEGGMPRNGDTSNRTWMKRVEQARETIWRGCHLQRLDFAAPQEFVRGPVAPLEQDELDVVLRAATAPLVEVWLRSDGVSPDAAKRAARLMDGLEDGQPTLR